MKLSTPWPYSCSDVGLEEFEEARYLAIGI